MITFVVPTRDRWLGGRGILARTLAEISAAARGGGLRAEVLIVDNASESPPDATAAQRACPGVPVRVLRLDHNAGAAARNLGAREADRTSDWLVMLDDDSWPLGSAAGGARLLAALAEAPAEVGAIAGEITLPGRRGRDGRTPLVHEAGGLPEVFVGCGVAIRREVFCSLGGYDASFGYYAEEYDLCARMILSGLRVAFDGRLAVHHCKTSTGRSFDRIAGNLVRNNAWVAARYAPPGRVLAEACSVVTRYGSIAHTEDAVPGFTRGLAQAVAGWRRQPRRPMSTAQWARFTGLEAAQRTLGELHRTAPLRRCAIVSPGKNAAVVARALDDLGVQRTSRPSEADTLVIGTLSPGPMLDGLAHWTARSGGRRVVCPWQPAHAGASAAAPPVTHAAITPAAPLAA